MNSHIGEEGLQSSGCRMLGALATKYGMEHIDLKLARSCVWRSVKMHWPTSLDVMCEMSYAQFQLLMCSLFKKRVV